MLWSLVSGSRDASSVMRWTLAGLVVCCWIFTPVPAHGQCSEPLFGSSKVLFVGDEPRGILAADFNHDATPDLAVICQGPLGAGVWVSLGSLSGGTFNFGPATVFPTGSSPSALTTADMDRDGNADLLIVASGSVAILRGNGVGGFAAPAFHSSLPNPTDVATGDFNADGYPDMAVTHTYNPMGLGGYISVFLSNGSGDFDAPVAYDANNSNTSVTVSDVNEDDIADLVVCVPPAFKFQVFLGTGTAGDGHFSVLPSETCVTPCRSPMTALVADFNNDGHLDVVDRADNNSMRLSDGEGDGTFPQIQYISGGLVIGGPVAGGPGDRPASGKTGPVARPGRSS